MFFLTEDCWKCNCNFIPEHKRAIMMIMLKTETAIERESKRVCACATLICSFAVNRHACLVMLLFQSRALLGFQKFSLNNRHKMRSIVLSKTTFLCIILKSGIETRSGKAEEFAYLRGFSSLEFSRE